MMRWLLVVVVATAAHPSAAYAQDPAPSTGAIVVTVIPGGATVFTEGDEAPAPRFTNYTVGASLEVQLNRYFGVEAEVTGALGVTQDLGVGAQPLELKPPDLLTYGGNVILSPGNRGSIVPYLAAGIGGLTMFEKPDLAIDDTQTFFTGTVGGGVKWFKGRWGLRADYRFTRVSSSSGDKSGGRLPAPNFLGRETRYGHRLYGGLLFKLSS